MNKLTVKELTPWLAVILLLIGLGIMGLWASETSTYIPDEEYLARIENGEAPLALPQSQKSISFQSGVCFILAGSLIAFLVFVLPILSSRLIFKNRKI